MVTGMFRQHYRSITAQTEDDGGVFAAFQVSSGVKQGCMLGTALLCITPAIFEPSTRGMCYFILIQLITFISDLPLRHAHISRGSIQPRCNQCAKTNIYLASYSFMHLNELEQCRVNEIHNVNS